MYVDSCEKCVYDHEDHELHSGPKLHLTSRTNRVLVRARQHLEDLNSYVTVNPWFNTNRVQRWAEFWIRIQHPNAHQDTIEEVVHARRVLSKLAAVAGD